MRNYLNACRGASAKVSDTCEPLSARSPFEQVLQAAQTEPTPQALARLATRMVGMYFRVGPPHVDQGPFRGCVVQRCFSQHFLATGGMLSCIRPVVARPYGCIRHASPRSRSEVI